MGTVYSFDRNDRNRPWKEDVLMLGAIIIIKNNLNPKNVKEY